MKRGPLWGSPTSLRYAVFCLAPMRASGCAVAHWLGWMRGMRNAQGERYILPT